MSWKGAVYMGKYILPPQHMVFESHETQNDVPIEISQKDLKVLRELGKKYAEISSLPIQNDRIKMWEKLNDLKQVKPLIWINEICWHEMDVNDELKLETSSEFCQKIETELRRIIYQWKHMQCDMVVEPIIYSPYIIQNTGFGLSPVAEVAITDVNSDIISRHFYNQFESEEDINKIRVPKISCNYKRTEDFFDAYKYIFSGIIQTEKRGSPGFWFAPWDDLVFWMGAEEVLTSLVTRPEFMHKLIAHLTDSFLKALEQFEELNLLALNNTNWRIGSGAYGYTDCLPREQSKMKNKVTTKDIWGSAAAQIFGSVSPKMHEEFALAYEMKWLEQFALTYYGCCEPLHNKLDLLKKIPNLRKISISPWAKLEEATEIIQDNYVISLKPSPSELASPTWCPEKIKKELESKLKVTKNCNVEIVLKDISTVMSEPKRLWEWARIASEVSKQFS
ncbi:MAG: hypothetical protein AB1767_11920 [Bacillota bacterium]